MLDLIIGFVMLIFFVGLTAYSFVTKDFDYNLKFWLQFLISGAGGFYILFYQNWDKIKNLFKRKEGDQVPESTSDDSCGKACCKLLESKDLQDYATLVYLRKRAQEMQSQEMLDLISKLNSILFSTTLQNQNKV